MTASAADKTAMDALKIVTATVMATVVAKTAKAATVADKTVVQVAAIVVDKVVAKAATKSHTPQSLLATNLNLSTTHTQWMSSKSAGTDL